MADVLVAGVRAPVAVVRLRQPPDVMIAEVAAVRFAGTDLVIQRPGPLIPHPLQEVQAEPGLAGEAGLPAAAHLAREGDHALQQHRLGVAGRLDEVQVVASVEPAAGRVDPYARRVPGQAALEVTIPVHPRCPVGHRMLIGEIAGSCAQRRLDEVRPVTLVLVEGESVRQGPGIQPGRGADLEPGRGDRGAGGQAEPVPARPGRGERHGPHPPIPLAPRAEVMPGGSGRGDHAPSGSRWAARRHS